VEQKQTICFRKGFDTLFSLKRLDQKWPGVKRPLFWHFVWEIVKAYTTKISLPLWSVRPWRRYKSNFNDSDFENVNDSVSNEDSNKETETSFLRLVLETWNIYFRWKVELQHKLKTYSWWEDLLETTVYLILWTLTIWSDNSNNLLNIIIVLIQILI
jgi:hypothetical protein